MESRRRAILAVALATGAAGLGALQPPSATAANVRRVAILDAHPRGHKEGIGQHFIGEMAKLGYVEGKDIEYLYRHEDDWSGPRLAVLCGEIVRARPEAIVTTGTPLTRALARATSTIPIVTNVGDPVGAGFAKSIAKPGGNITGLALASPELYEKTFDYLKAMIPGNWALAVAAGNLESKPLVRAMVDAAQKHGIPIRRAAFEGLDARQADRTLAAMRGQGVRVLILREKVAGIPDEDNDLLLAAKYGLVTIVRDEEAVSRGALMMYFPVALDAEDRRAAQVVRILRGTPPGEIPFHTPSRYALLVNRRTARLLGLTIPREILSLADQVYD